MGRTERNSESLDFIGYSKGPSGLWYYKFIFNIIKTDVNIFVSVLCYKLNLIYFL